MVDERLAERFDEYHWRLDSQRKEIERLREEALARNAVIGKLQADKVTLMEMLERAKKYIEAIDGMTFSDDDAILRRIDGLLTRIRSFDLS